ncbi:MAG: apolipoprotein N-acyltransferase [Alistipes sp.]|nr:apolipoprotein N-acyltransferase [Alistipes sp.]
MSLKIKLLCVALSIAMLAPAWLGGSGLTLLVALVPLMMISASYSDSLRDWWRMAGWAALTFVLWNAATIWWVWIATPAGPITATIFSTFWNLVGFMLYHYASKRASRALSYTLLAFTWVATEYLYTSAEVLSFPWLTLGNGFSGDVWAVQWYSLTGVFGGSLWVLLCNIAIFEFVIRRSKRAAVLPVVVVAVPLMVSLVMYWMYEPSRQEVQVSVLQPNVDCYEEKFSGNEQAQMKNILGLLSQTLSSSSVAVLPETALPERLDDDEPLQGYVVKEFASLVGGNLPQTMLVSGATTIKEYDTQSKPTPTARVSWGTYYDVYNSAIAINSDTDDMLHHKMRLVIGVEAMPFTGFLDKFVDLGGITGQLGRNDKATVFEKAGVKYGPAICYEGIYGDCFARFVREGAQTMLVMSNDGWWGNTPGHKRLFDYCRLRAVECRRAIARSANTGVSGFITSRGDVIESMGWDKRGVLTANVEVRDDKTMYVLYGDWVGRLSLLVSLLGVMYLGAYMVKRKNHLVA